MKKLLVCSLCLLSLSSPSYSASVGPIQNKVLVTFNFSHGRSDTFHCDIRSDQVTHVHMQNHSAIVYGFDNDGAADFEGVAMSVLKNFYFEAKPDPSSSTNIDANVLVTFDGPSGGVTCQHGKGDRNLRYGLAAN